MERGADEAVDALRERGSPAHDGLAARLAGFEASPERLVVRDAAGPLGAAAGRGRRRVAGADRAVRGARRGRALAGRAAARRGWRRGPTNGRSARAARSRWGSRPALTLSRELDEEWQLTPTSLSVEALVYLPSGLVSLVGLATVPAGAEPVPDAEHDEFAWWPADVERWPDEADDRLRALAAGLAAASA